MLYTVCGGVYLYHIWGCTGLPEIGNMGSTPIISTNGCDADRLIRDGFFGVLAPITDMMELDPKYCDVIVNRYINFKQSDDDVLLLRDGQTLPYKEIICREGDLKS